MGKRCLNGTWLEKVDTNNQIVGVWYVKKDYYTTACKLHLKDINVENMGFGALKQHSENWKHRGLASAASIYSCQENLINKL